MTPTKNRKADTSREGAEQGGGYKQDNLAEYQGKRNRIGNRAHLQKIIQNQNMIPTTPWKEPKLERRDKWTTKTVLSENA